MQDLSTAILPTFVRHLARFSLSRRVARSLGDIWASSVHPRSPSQCKRTTESIMPLLTRPLCCFRHYWPWHLDHPSLILVWYPWLCSQLVQVISVISLLPCQMCNWPLFLAHILLRCPPRLCPWSTALRHVHHSSQYSHFLFFDKLSPNPHPVLWVTLPPSVPSTHHSSTHWLHGHVLLSNSTFLIFAVWVVWCRHSRP